MQLRENWRVPTECLADLFCGQGGAGVGYGLAGFDRRVIIGVDSDVRAFGRYPFAGYCMDWREGLAECLKRYNIVLIHASPVCKGYSEATPKHLRDSHPDQIPEVREALQATGLPYVIENVPGAPLRDPVELCGCMFDLRGTYRGDVFAIYRPRLFECGGGFTFAAPRPCRAYEHRHHNLDVFGHGSPGRFYREFGYGIPASFAKEVMGVPWMTRDGMSQAIPPAFTEYIGSEFLEWRKANERVAA